MKNQAPKSGFLVQIESSKREVQSWPSWMRNSATTASASLRASATPAARDVPVKAAMARSKKG